MSGILYEAETPCPPSRFERNSYGTNAFDSTWDDSLDPLDDTGNIDFTAEIRAPVLTAKPKRANRATSFQIHEDTQKPAPPVVKRQMENVTAAAPNCKSSLLSQPAQRFRPKVNFGASSPKAPRQQAPPKRRIEGRESNAEENKALLARINENGQGSQGKDDLKRGVRRDTVYIPDDSTVPRVFMGLFSPLRSEKTKSTKDYGPDDSQLISLESRIAEKGRARRAHATSPRKAPLQPCAKAVQEASIQTDIAGKNGGKENIPPGMVQVDNGHKIHLPVAELPQKSKRTPGNGLSSSKLIKSLPNTDRASASSTNRMSTARSVHERPEKRPVLGDKQCNGRAPTSRKEYSISQMANSPGTAKRPRARTISSDVAPGLKLKKLNNEYPLLAENISNPGMYEDDWLSHQEIVITQLVNGLFDYTDGKTSSEDPETLRYELLKLYQNDFFAQLHRRLQASLSSGSMSIPQFILERTSCLKHDLGLKRKFIDIWIQTYDIRALRAAVETVIGRRISDSKSRDDAGSGYDMILRRRVEHFLEVFLLRNADMGDTDKRTGAFSRAYRRTVLRSIMVIVLLDKGRLCPGTMLPRQLLASTSRFKSSAAVLQALGRLLLPSSGDLNKPLGHMDCRLSYKQHELQEYEYQISNLAVDLRDGVRLTRIVELLLYPSSLCLNGVEPDSDSSTVSLPDGEPLSLSGDDGNYPLSQHLKLPCVSRAVKLFNVRVALGALQSASTGSTAKDIQAEDIVDGHREKTMALLWGLVSQWGLAGLVDWDDIRREIERLHRKVLESGYEQANNASWFEGQDELDQHSLLLKQWASLLAQLKGQRFDNLRTNFADGKIYESIVDEYEGYIGGSGRTDAGADSLGLRLERLGCSSQFAYLVSPGSDGYHVQSSEFTLVSLAFLSSRLLSGSKRARAATSLQRAWRRMVACREVHRRRAAREMAQQCAAVVQAKEQILWAQATIARWWRSHGPKRSDPRQVVSRISDG